MRSVAAGAVALGARAQQKGLPLEQFEPRSMLKVRETAVERARFPVIDFHTHITFSGRGGKNRYLAPPEELLAVMERRNLATMVNLTGGNGEGLAETVGKYDRAHAGRFLTFTEPMWGRAAEEGYARVQAEEMGKAKAAGARGLKILKTLGLYLRDGGKTGTLVKIDDARFDPLWEACGALGLPVAMHVSDPLAFFTVTDRYNERYEELNAHPDWSFAGVGFPSHAELMAARDRVFARHPKTQFVGLHMGHAAEDLGFVEESLKKFPNLTVDIAARIGELGRQPRTARRFFDKWQDRILFGTDATPHGTQTPQQLFGDELYRIYFRFLETEDEYFDYAPAPVPPQGRWRIYGLGLGEGVLRKVYRENALRLLGGRI